jgi:GT2 family glycosyltransferase
MLSTHRSIKSASSSIPVLNLTAAISNYNGGDLLLAAVHSLKDLNHPPSEIIVIDDGSTDDSLARLRRMHPDVRVIALGENSGSLNVVRNRALEAARHRYVLVSDNDVTFAPDAIDRLLEVMRAGERVAVCTPLVLDGDDRSSVYGAGHGLHFLCWSCRRRIVNLKEAEGVAPFPGTGCGIQLVDKQLVAGLGFFDPDMALGWGDDGEFHFRVQATGLSCLVVPDAIVFHYRIRTSPRVYGLVHNRALFMLKDFEVKTLILAAPALIAFEFALVAFLIATGKGSEYLRAWRNVFAKRDRIGQARRKLRGRRRVRDRDLLCADDPLLTAVSSAPGGNALSASRLTSAALGAYWRIVRLLL